MPSASVSTYSGKLFDVANPSSDDFEIFDIAQGLSLTNQISQQVRAFYSAAQHAVYLSFMVSEEKAMAALLRSAASAYLPRPSSMISHLFPDHAVFSAGLRQKIGKAFGIEDAAFDDEEITSFEEMLTSMEATILCETPEHMWALSGGRPDRTMFEAFAGFALWQPAQARDMFITRLFQIRNGVSERDMAEAAV